MEAAGSGTPPAGRKEAATERLELRGLSCKGARARLAGLDGALLALAVAAVG